MKEKNPIKKAESNQRKLFLSMIAIVIFCLSGIFEIIPPWYLIFSPFLLIPYFWFAMNSLEHLFDGGYIEAKIDQEFRK